MLKRELLRALLAFPEYLSSIPTTKRQLPPVSNSTSQGMQCLCALLRYQANRHCGYTDSHAGKTPYVKDKT